MQAWAQVRINLQWISPFNDKWRGLEVALPCFSPFRLPLCRLLFNIGTSIQRETIQQMGASESLLARQSPVQQSQFVDEITTVSERIQGVDPLVERIRTLKIVSSHPLLLHLQIRTTSILQI